MVAMGAMGVMVVALAAVVVRERLLVERTNPCTIMGRVHRSTVLAARGGRAALMAIAASIRKTAIPSLVVTRMRGGLVLFPAVEVYNIMPVELPDLAIPRHVFGLN